MTHRKIWLETFGSIPLDEDGRTYEIHHIDGNRSNNKIENLKCVSIREHYDIHYNQEDWNACRLIAMRMKTSPSSQSELARLACKRQIENGTHPFLSGEIQRQYNYRRIADGTHPFLGDFQRKKVENGTHHFLGGEIQRKRVKDGTHHLCGGELQRKRVAEGKHNWLGGELQRKQMADGTHPCVQLHSCPYCNKTGKGAAMKRWHFDNCKMKISEGT